MDALRNYNNYDYQYPRSTKVHRINRVPEDPVTEPVTLAEAKVQVKVDHSEEDTMLQDFCAAARRWIEDYTGLSLVPTIITVDLELFGKTYLLPYGPYVDALVITDSEDVTISTDNYEIIGADKSVTVDYGAFGRYRLVYNAGYAEGECPVSLKRAILFYIEYLYDPSELGKKAKEKAMELASPFKQKSWLI
jgi:uncharacterized phiE125 gp8 family phage protein